MIQKLASITYGSHEEGESCSDGADSLEPVVGDHRVGELQEVFRIEPTRAKVGEEETPGQAEDEVDHPDHDGTHLHVVVYDEDEDDDHSDVDGDCDNVVEDAVFDGDDYLEGAAAAEVGEDWTLAHFVFQSEEGFSRL